MNILIIGASGFLGKKIYDRLKENQGNKLIGTYSSDRDGKIRELGDNKDFQDFLKFDISEESSVDKLDKEVMKRFGKKPDFVIHCAAMTDVDYCELHQEEANLVNANGTESLAKHFKQGFIYISTDFVFDGEKGDYSEKDIPKPPNYYALTKYLGEKAVRENCDDYMIVRVAVLYGASSNKKKFTNWAVDQLKAKNQIRVVTDQICTPTLIEDIASGLERLITIRKDEGSKKEKKYASNKTGENNIFHVAGSQKLSRYDMALEIADTFGFDRKLITPIKTSDLNQVAKRPKDSSLKIDKIKKLGIKMSSFQEGIRKVKEQMEAIT